MRGVGMHRWGRREDGLMGANDNTMYNGRARTSVNGWLVEVVFGYLVVGLRGVVEGYYE